MAFPTKALVFLSILFLQQILEYHSHALLDMVGAVLLSNIYEAIDFPSLMAENVWLSSSHKMVVYPSHVSVMTFEKGGGQALLPCDQLCCQYSSGIGVFPHSVALRIGLQANLAF